MLHCLAKHLQLFPATVKPIGKLIAIAAQVLYRNLMERAVDSALEQGECALNRIGVNVAHRIRASVVNDAMPREFALADYRVCRMAVRLECCIRRDVVVYDRLNYL